MFATEPEFEPKLMIGMPSKEKIKSIDTFLNCSYEVVLKKAKEEAEEKARREAEQWDQAA